MSVACEADPSIAGPFRKTQTLHTCSQSSDDSGATDRCLNDGDHVCEFGFEGGVEVG